MNPLRGVASIMDPLGGYGLMEALFFLIVLAAIIYMNIAGIEVNDILQKIAIGLLGYWIAKAEDREDRDGNADS